MKKNSYVYLSLCHILLKTAGMFYYFHDPIFKNSIQNANTSDIRELRKY